MLTLYVPDTVTAHILVATGIHVRPGPAELEALLLDARGRGPAQAGLAQAALELVRSAGVHVTAEPAAESAWAERLDNLAGRAADLARLRAAGHHLILTSSPAPGAQPAHCRAVRFLARLLAERTGGLVADLSANLVLPHGHLPALERPRFALADDWIITCLTAPGPPAVTAGGGEGGGHEPEPGAVFFAPSGEGDGPGTRVETLGLHRFGLPDLAVPDVPGDRVVTAVNLLRALAWRQLAEHWRWLAAHPGVSLRALGEEVLADTADLWHFWAADPVGRATVPVVLRADPAACPACLPLLDVLPPPGYDPAEWWTHAYARIPPIAELRPDPAPPH